MSQLIPAFDAAKVDAAIEAVFREEKNAAPRYNPFLLLEPDAEFDRLILENAREQTLTSLLNPSE